MSKPLKICVITGTRAEYGLLFWTMKALKSDPEITLQIIATGMHLSPEFGLTYKNIENDGFTIDKKVEMLLSSDTPVGISKSMGLGMISFSEAFSELQPDLILVLGDRFEILAAATAAMVSRIPIAHCHGGEATEGLIDEAIRHSITKMSQVHFTATEEYRKRVIQLGEQPEMVHNVGALGIENINRLKLMTRPEFEKSIAWQLGQKNILVTYHPVTLDTSLAEEQFNALLDVLAEQQHVKVIFTKANADTDGRIINQLIDKYVNEHGSQAVGFTSLGQLRYLSSLQFMDAVVGNSSSGLIEAPSFHIPTINIGDRQRGRIKAETVIDCEPEKQSLQAAFRLALDGSFSEKVKNAENPYGSHNASEKIVNILKQLEPGKILKKKFHDL